MSVSIWTICIVWTRGIGAAPSDELKRSTFVFRSSVHSSSAILPLPLTVKKNHLTEKLTMDQTGNPGPCRNTRRRENATGEASKEVKMMLSIKRLLFAVLLLGLSPFILPSNAQQSAAPIKVDHLTGLTGVKNNTKGNVTIDNGNLRFAHGKTNVDLPAASMQDVVTGNDSQRLIHGTLGLLMIAAPYESGRFMSLFRTKLETVTIKYLDADGGLHGAIFTMGVGKAEPLKKELVAHGAHTSVPIQEDADTTSTNAPDAKEPKP
jgi:hypothetical protein